MSHIRISKVRITDNRLPTAGKPSPVERRAGATTGGGMTGLDYLEAAQKREAAEHDRNVRDYTPQMVQAAWNDLADRPAHNRKDPEQRWVAARRAALRRLGISMRERGLA
jgi:hypothetical protein